MKDNETWSQPGYKVCELYVNKKYESFGEEIRHYRYMDIKQYNITVIVKAKHYITTDKVKSIKLFPLCAPTNYGECDYGDPLKIHNLMSLILYTDFTNLSSDFSASFRKKYSYETISGVKRRNRKYFWWSKTLRETVELFGPNASSMEQPFYTGMSYIMNMPSFSIRLCSPTSTSVQLAVAVKFGGGKGLILQLKCRSMISTPVRAFDCSFISRFKEEDER